MNYRHHFHAGNFADVAKHALLVQLARGMQRKPKGCLFLDTHAGRGEYDLSLAQTGDSLARQPEYPDGIGRLWSRPDLPAPLAEYLVLVKAHDRAQTSALGTTRATPSYYPGSPRLLRLLARPQDRLVFCEMRPDEYRALKDGFRGDRAVLVRHLDGYEAVAALLPPPERRALVLIDPPFEDAGESERIVETLQEGLKRLPGGTFAVWYPLTGRARVDSLFEGLQDLRMPPTLAVETVIDPNAAKMKGCGLLILNPPWQFDAVAAPITSFLAKALAQSPGASGALRWLVPE